MYAKAMRIDAHPPAEVFGNVFTEYGLPPSIIKAGGTVITEM